MVDLFIPKIVIGNFKIGSFDIYKDLAKKLIMENSLVDDSEASKIMDSLADSYRASIVYKDGSYIGFIGLYNVDESRHMASIHLETSSNIISVQDKNSILRAYMDWVTYSLHLNIIKEMTYVDFLHKRVEAIPLSFPNVSLPFNPLLLPGISLRTLQLFSKQYPNDILDLELSFSIKYRDKIIAIIGLSDIIWSNESATLNLYLNKEIDSSYYTILSNHVINDYLDYIHSMNIHNVSCRIPSTDKERLAIINASNMNFYGQIPFSVLDGKEITSSILFQHIPGMLRDEQTLLPLPVSCKEKLFHTTRSHLKRILSVNPYYKLVSPRMFCRLGIDMCSVLENHILAMLDREYFTKPLLEDKYILNSCSLFNRFKNFTYFLLDNHGRYHGFVNIIKKEVNNRNIEIVVGIDPLSQHNGLGTIVLDSIYKELFSVGYASVTTTSLSCNTTFLHLNRKLAEFCGIRLESYYLNGHLCNMHYYTKVNDIVSLKKGKCMKKTL